MKILFVRTYCPNPIIYGSEMRGGRFVDYFRKRAEVDLLTLTRPTTMADESYIKNKFSHFYYFDQRGEHVRMTAIEKLIHLLPWQITMLYAKDFQKQFNRIIEENQYDLIFVFKLEPVFYFLQLPRKWRERVVIDFDDILSDLYFNFYKSFFIARKNSYSLKLYEKKALRQFKRVLVCSNDALAKIHPRYRSKVGVIPNIFQANRENFLPASTQKNNLLFVGSLDYFPNTDGLRWFFSSVWPEVKETYPWLKMTIAGKRQKDKDTELLYSLFGRPKDVEINLNVPSVRGYYQNCFASIVPLLNGSGTRLKILESAAYGRPVLTTLKGMEGLDFDDGKNIFVFKDAPSFLDGYKVLLDEERYRKATQDAFRALEERYSPDAFTSSIDENWQRMTA